MLKFLRRKWGGKHRWTICELIILLFCSLLLLWNKPSTCLISACIKLYCSSESPFFIFSCMSLYLSFARSSLDDFLELTRFCLHFNNIVPTSVFNVLLLRYIVPRSIETVKKNQWKNILCQWKTMSLILYFIPVP